MSERDELFVRWELGQADAADETALAEALRDPEARRAFARNARIAAALGTPVPKSATLASENLTPARPRTLRVRQPRQTTVPGWAMAAGLALTIGLTALLMAMPRHDETTSHAHVAPPTPPTSFVVPQTAPFAHLETAGAARIVTSNGQRRTGHDGEALAHGETVETGSGDAVIVLGANLARLELATGSSLSLPIGTADPAANTVQMSLGSGRVRAEIAPRPAGAPFIITSPLATAEVVGTRFSFGIDHDGARLAVDHGAVRLSTATDPGVLVAAGHSGLVTEGLASFVPPTADADQPLPVGSRVLWRCDPTDANGWRGVIEDATNGGPTWRSVAPRPGDQWCRAELRSPQAHDGWAVAPGTWLRFRYHIERFTPGLDLVVHLKPSDETNYAQRLVADATDGWHQVLLRVDDTFRHVERGQQPLAVGERIHGAVWCAMRGDTGNLSPARFWIRDAVVFTAP